MLKSDQVVMTCTSMPSRINEIHRTISSVLGMEVLPFRLIINLSEEEFPNKLGSLPNNLVELLDNDIVELHWVERNTFTYKKVLPTVDRYADYAIMSVDDDIEYPKDSLEKFINTYNLYDGKYSITMSQLFLCSKSSGVENIGRGFLMKPNLLRDYRYYLTEDVIKLKHDDAFIRNYMESRGELIAPVLSLDPSTITYFNHNSEWGGFEEVKVKTEYMNSKLKDYIRISRLLSLDYLLNSDDGPKNCRSRINLPRYTNNW